MKRVTTEAPADSGIVYKGFKCPGCGRYHDVVIQKPPASPLPLWTYNGNDERPTFQPSLLCTWKLWDKVRDAWGPEQRCHSYITDGRIQFLQDCTHPFAGQTLDLPEISGT